MIPSHIPLALPPPSSDLANVGSGTGEVADAPHTGALVRFDDAHWSGLVGATRPG